MNSLFFALLLVVLAACATVENVPLAVAPSPVSPLQRIGVKNSYDLLGANEEERLKNYSRLVEAAKAEGLETTPELQREWSRVLFETYLSQKLTAAGLPKELDENQLKELYEAAPLLRIRHIALIASSPKEKQIAKVQIEKLNAELKKGIPFPKLAQKYSEDNTGSKGGDLDFRGSHNLPAALYSAAKKLKINEVSDPIDLGESIHVVQLTAKREFADAGAPYLEFLRARQREDQVRSFTLQLFAPTTTPVAPRMRPRGNQRLQAPNPPDRVARGLETPEEEESK